MFEARRELLGLKTSGLEQITLIPPVMSSENFNHAGITLKNDDVMSRHSGSSFGYHSSEEPEINSHRNRHRDTYTKILFLNVIGYRLKNHHKKKLKEIGHRVNLTFFEIFSSVKNYFNLF